MRRIRSGTESEDFVLAAVRSYATAAPCPPPPSHDAWVEVVQRTNVIPTVLGTLRAGGWTLPMRALPHRFDGGATYLRAMAELRPIIDALAEGGVRWVLLKGPVLAQVIYRTPASRSYLDLDVLVHPEDLGVALDCLEGADFAVLDRNWPMVAGSGRGEISILSPTGMVVDLHWHPVNDRAIRTDLQVDVRSMINRRIDVDIDGLAIPTLDPVDTVVYVALHASLSGGHQLKWLLDLQQAVRWSSCTSDQLRARAAQHGAGLIVQTMLRRAAQYVDPGLGPLAAAVAPDSAWGALCCATSARNPPLGAPSGRHSGRVVFAATRQTTRCSAVRMVTALAVATRDRVPALDRSVDVTVLHRSAGTDVDRARWIAAAAASP